MAWDVDATQDRGNKVTVTGNTRNRRRHGVWLSRSRGTRHGRSDDRVADPAEGIVFFLQQHYQELGLGQGPSAWA